MARAVYRRPRDRPSRSPSTNDLPDSSAPDSTRPRLEPADLDPGAELHRLMVTWRARLRTDRRRQDRARRLRHLSQEDMAALVGVSPGWYGSLERGERGPAYSEAFLDRVAECLKLSTGERRVLYQLAVGREPAARPYAPPKISEAVRALLHAQPWPAYICDATWDVLAYNDVTAAWFPHVLTERNWMRWALLDPRSREQLVNWHSIHAPLMLAQLRAQHALLPHCQGVTDLLAEILERSTVARHIWDTEPRVWLHDDGDQREIRLPGAPEPTAVEIVAWTPMRNPDLRATMIVPRGGHIPRQPTASPG